MTKKAVGDVNASQLVGMFGPGSIVNLESVSVMPEAPVKLAGLQPNDFEPDVRSPDRSSGAYRLRSHGFQLRTLAHLPDDIRCHKCGSIRRERILSSDQLSHGLRCSSADKERMHPSRWVVFCPRGHIDDFDYDRFVHAQSKCDDPHVQLLTRDTVVRRGSRVCIAAPTALCRRPMRWSGRENALPIGPGKVAATRIVMRSRSCPCGRHGTVTFGAIRSAISIEPETKRSVRTVFEILSKSKVITREDALYFLKIQ